MPGPLFPASTSLAKGERAMNEQDRILLHNSLIEANRALINITEPSLSERSFQKNDAIENCLVAYGNLLHCHGTLPLSPDESANVREFWTASERI